MKNKKVISTVLLVIFVLAVGFVFKDDILSQEDEVSIISEIESSVYSDDDEQSEDDIINETEYFTETETVQIDNIDNKIVLEEGSYTTPEDVAEYIHQFGKLPDNFITKDDAMALGWESSKGNLWDVADGKSIGGDYFGNYEGKLPVADGRTWTECDVNYSGGYRGSERVIFSNDGLIFYTNDHYETFVQLY